MRLKKKYGDYRVDSCPFCGVRATTENNQGVPVCIKHKDEKLLDLKCVCGDWLDVKKGKFGPYFNCFKCGNISFSKAMELNQIVAKPKNTETKEAKTVTSKKDETPKEKRKEIQITSDDIGITY